MADPELDRLIARLNDPSMGGRGQATYQLAAKGAAAIPCLLAAAEGRWKNHFGVACSNDSQIRRGAIIALRKMGASAADAVSTLTQLLSDDDPVLRWESAQALEEIGGAARSAIPALESLVGDPHYDVRAAALQALRQLAVR